MYKKDGFQIITKSEQLGDLLDIEDESELEDQTSRNGEARSQMEDMGVLKQETPESKDLPFKNEQSKQWSAASEQFSNGA